MGVDAGLRSPMGAQPHLPALRRKWVSASFTGQISLVGGITVEGQTVRANETVRGECRWCVCHAADSNHVERDDFGF